MAWLIGLCGLAQASCFIGEFSPLVLFAANYYGHVFILKRAIKNLVKRKSIFDLVVKCIGWALVLTFWSNVVDGLLILTLWSNGVDMS